MIVSVVEAQAVRAFCNRTGGYVISPVKFQATNVLVNEPFEDDWDVSDWKVAQVVDDPRWIVDADAQATSDAWEWAVRDTQFRTHPVKVMGHLLREENICLLCQTKEMTTDLMQELGEHDIDVAYLALNEDEAEALNGRYALYFALD